METTKSFKDLFVYQKAYELCLDIYLLTKSFPKEEIYTMVSQMRRAALSIPSNIAEGYRRKSRKEYVQFLHIAYGSCAELYTQLSLSKDLKYAPEEKSSKLTNDLNLISISLYKMIVSLEK